MSALSAVLAIVASLIYTSIGLTFLQQHWKMGNQRNHGLISFSDKQMYWLCLFWPAYVGFFIALIALAWLSLFVGWVSDHWPFKKSTS